MTRKVLSIAALVIFLASQASLAAAARPVRVVYGFDREFPPFSFEDPGGKAVGFEVEVLEAALNNRATLVHRPMQWRLIQTELAAGTITITSGMIKTEERQKLYLFPARPNYRLQIHLFTKTYNRFPNATFFRGQRVSVEEGSLAHRLLDAFGGVNVKPYSDKTSPIKALFNDEVEGYCGPAPNAYYYMNKLGYSGMTTLGTPLGIPELSFMVNRERGDIVRLVNEGMNTIIQNGEYDRIYRKWFVREPTAEESLNLLKAAKESLYTVYSPYTGRSKGAALLTATGQIYKGSSVENADRAQSISAVSSALASAVNAGDIEIRAVISVDGNGNPVPLTPTEMQTLYEFGRGILVLTFNSEKLLSGRMIGEMIANPVTAKAMPEAWQ